MNLSNSEPIPFRWSAGLLLLLSAALTLFAWNTNAPFMWQVLTSSNDQLGYYQYLPAVLIDGGWEHMRYVHYLDNGNGLNLFTMGVAILQAPFFLVAWAWCTITGIEATGYELPFIFARFVATASYTSLGIVLLINVLLRRFHWSAAWGAGGLILFGTSLYFYSVHAGGMSHAYSFFLMASTFLLTDRMLRDPGPVPLILLCLCMALLLLIRPLHAVVGLFVLFFGNTSFTRSVQIRLGWVRSFPKATAAGVMGALLLWVPQLIYWHATTDSWFVFTYGKKGEGFDWLHPHLSDTLFGLQNGWFIYTPLMAVVMVILLWQAWKGVGNARLILIMWVLVWYVYASWWCWWLGGAFGYRGFIEYYAFLALPLAWGLDRVRGFSRPWLIAGMVVMILLVRTNVRLSLLYEYPWERPTWTWTKLANVYQKALWY